MQRAVGAVGLVVEHKTAQIHRLAAAVVQLDPLIVGVGCAVAVPIRIARRGEKLVQHHAQRVRRGGECGRGSGRDRGCRRRGGWLVGCSRRRRVGIGPGAAAVHRAAVGDVHGGVAVGPDIGHAAVGVEQPCFITAVVVEAEGAVEDQEACRGDGRARRDGVGRVAAVGIVQLPAAEVHDAVARVVQFDPFVPAARPGHEFVEPHRCGIGSGRWRQCGCVCGSGGQRGRRSGSRGGRKRCGFCCRGCRRRGRWLVGCPWRRRVGVRPGAAAVHRAAVGDVHGRVAVGPGIGHAAVGVEQPRLIAAAVVEAEGAVEDQEACRGDGCARRDGVG